MFIYQPPGDLSVRAVWYGGESNELHYETYDDNDEWHAKVIGTLEDGIPVGVSELHAELVEFYNHCIDEVLI